MAISDLSNQSLVEQVINRQIGLDIETLGLQKGAGIVELSLYDPASKTVKQFALHEQDVTNLRSTRGDVLQD